MNQSDAAATPSQRRAFNRWLLAAATAGSLPGAAFAREDDAAGFPSKPIRMIVPFTPGGSTDILARSVGDGLTRAWGQPVIVESVPGAGGSIGSDKVAKSAPDGYTLLIGNVGTLAVTPSLYPKLPYDPIKSFSAVAWVARVPNLLVVHPSVPATTLKELVAYAQAHPDKINYGSGGNGSAAHIATEYFKLQTHTEMQHVPYRGTAPAVTELIAGQIQLMFTGIPAVMGQVKAGQLRALAVSSPKRAHALPDVPTVAESGYPGFEADQWYGIVGPAGMAPAVVQKLNQQINRVLQTPEVVERLAGEGAEVTPATPEVFARLMQTELLRWREVIRAGNVRLE